MLPFYLLENPYALKLFYMCTRIYREIRTPNLIDKPFFLIIFKGPLAIFWSINLFVPREILQFLLQSVILGSDGDGSGSVDSNGR